MSNRELAAKIIHHMTGDLQRAHYVAEELADAGLLAPDAPEPGVFKDGAEVEWATLDGYVNVENGLITISHDERTEDDTAEQLERLRVDEGQIIITNPKTAEQMGHLLVAAANYTEG